MFKDLMIRAKLILIFSAIGIGIICIVSYIGYSTAKKSMEQESYNKLIAVREIKKTQIQEFLEEKVKDITVLALGVDVQRLFEQLVQYHIDTKVGPNDPYNVSTTAYKTIYNTYGSIFAQYIKLYGYHDIYLMCSAHGHVMYTTAKKKDLGTNLNAGPYRDSALAKLWRKVVNTQQVAIEDFQPYAPQNGEPASFIGTPLTAKTGEMIGVIALQISVDEINKIMQQREGLGKTGEAYLVGSDKLMRSDSFLDPENHSVVSSFRDPTKGKVDTEASRDALDGKTDAKIITDYLGNRVLSAYTFVDIPGDVRWALLVEIGESEAFKDVYSLRNTAFFWGVLLIGVIIVGAIVFSRSLTRPLKLAVAVAEQVSQGDLDVQFDITSQDEIGQMLMAMKKMTTYIQDVAAVSEKISNQDLQVEVTPKSKQDVLNHSLQKMVNALQSAKEEIERSMAEIKHQNWLKDGINQLNTSLSGEASLQETCHKAVSFIARFVGAGHGVLYTYDAEHHMLNLGGAFALTEHDQLSETYRLGEGVIGQVAQERSPILLKNLKRADHLINTGTVSEPPLNTYTFPLIYNDELYGVLEVASFELLDEAKQNFLNEANQVIATVLFSAMQRERVQELLQTSQRAAKEAEQMAKEAENAKEEAQQQAEAAQKANVRLEEQQQQLRQQSEELQQINAHLEEQQQQIQQQREELQQQNEHLKFAQEELERRSQELESVSQNKSEFLATISHELRSPLNSIILVSNMLSKNSKGNLDDKDIEQIKTIHQAGEELLDLINGILELSKIESGDGSTPLTMTVTMSEVEERDEGRQEKQGVMGAEQTLRVSPTPYSTARILIVEDNATQREAIQELLRENDKIETTGVASQKEAIEEITKGRYHVAIIDLGLRDGSGCDICQYIKAHDISLPVIVYTGRDLTEEEERELRTYTDSIIIKTTRSFERLLDEISMLLHKRESREGAPQPPSKLTVDLTGKKILIADDDIKNVFILASALENHGATVIEAKNGAIALEKLHQEGDVDLVLLDVMMPGKDGYTTMREIRKDEQLKHLSIIALTAKALKDDRQKCLQAGANDYLSKPVDYETLIRLVDTWVEKE